MLRTFLFYIRDPCVKQMKLVILYPVDIFLSFYHYKQLFIDNWKLFGCRNREMITHFKIFSEKWNKLYKSEILKAGTSLEKSEKYVRLLAQGAKGLYKG